jgi:predicted small lipoprotein YifL
MRLILSAALVLAACGPAAPHEYPPDARAQFAEGCPTGKPECDCMWDRITRTMTADEFDVAMSRYKEKGLMDPKLTTARLECREAS